MIVSAVSFQPPRSALARVTSVKSMLEVEPSSEPLRSALVRSALLKSMVEEP